MKQKLDDLAVFGGGRMFPEDLHVGRPNIPDKVALLKRFDDILESKWLTNNGAQVEEFEKRIADMIGVQHCIAICNATTALQILCHAAGVTGEVIVPSFTFVATAHALSWLGITPVFCDIDRQTYQIDPGKIDRLISSRTSAILGVHLWGRPCEVEKIQEIGLRRNLKVFFDAAQAFGSSYHGRMVGSFGDAEVLSFHATKVMNSFEGGAVVTDDEELAHRIRLMRSFGFSGYDLVISAGTNGKMSEISAAMGCLSLENIQEFINRNYQNLKLYRRELAGIPWISLLQYDEREKSNFHYIVLEIDEDAAHISRDYLVNILMAEGVLARTYFSPGCHRMEPYRSKFPEAAEHLTNTELVCRRVISLPTGMSIDAEKIIEIAGLVRFAVQHGSEISRQLQNQ